MSQETIPKPWTLAAREVQEETLRSMLKVAAGNVSLAAAELGIARSHATRLVKKYGLGEFAKRLRVEAGTSESGHGRPWSKKLDGLE